MWKCTNCHHIHIVTDQPARCSVCGKEADSLVPHEVPGIKGEKTLQNLKAGFVAESQATLRNLAFAMRAEEEGYRQMAKLFRAVSEAGGVHAKLYEKALQHMLADADTEYYVYGVCGYVSDGVLPEECPICGAPRQRFRKAA